MRRASYLTLVSILFFLAQLSAASELLSRSQAYALAGSARADVSVAKIKQSPDSDSVVGQLKQIAARFDLTAAEKERVTYDGLRFLSTLPPNTAAWEFVNELATTTPVTYVEHEEGQGRAVPLYDVGALARSVQRYWLMERAKDNALAQIIAADPAVLSVFGSPAGDTVVEIDRDGIARAFAEAPMHALLPYRDELLNRLAAGQSVGRMVAMVAGRLADKDMFVALSLNGSAVIVARTLQAATNVLPAADAFEILKSAANRPDTASAALLAMVPLAGSMPSATDYLFSQLGDAVRGASAATALARIGDTITIRRLGSIVASGKDGTVERQAMLALRLSNSSAADDEIRDFLADPGASAKLRSEVSQWQAD